MKKYYVTKAISKIKIVMRNRFSSTKIKEFEQAKTVLNNIYPIKECVVFSNNVINDYYELNCDLSVILPTYNNGSYVGECISSILSQITKYSVEIIVINDGSSDNTTEVLNSICDSRLFVIHQTNSGISAARNSGLKNAKGKYIMFVDSDDILLPGAIDSLMNMAYRQNADVVAGGYCIFDEKCKQHQGISYTDGLVNPRIHYYGQPWGKVYRHEIFEHLVFPVGFWFEDSIFSQIVWPMCKNCYTIKELVYGYNNNQSSISHSARGKVKSLDSLYLTNSLFREKEKFSLDISQEDYDYFLKMNIQTYKRIRLLEYSIIEAVFWYQLSIKDTMFRNYSYHGKSKKYYQVEKSLLSHNCKKYVITCERGIL